MTDEITFQGHLYGYGRNKTTAELADEIREKLENACRYGRLPAEIKCTVTDTVTVQHSNTLMVIATGPVHPAEYATIIDIAQAYNLITREFSQYRLEVYAPNSPEARAHPAFQLADQLGQYQDEWTLLTVEEREGIVAARNGLERLAAAQALTTPETQ